MAVITKDAHWNIAAAATAIAGTALVLLQPQWWEGALYTVFQCSLILWLHPRQSAANVDVADSLIDEIHDLRNRLDEHRDLLSRVLPLWDEQIQEAQDQLNMPGSAISGALPVRINLILDAVRADMRRLCEIAGRDNDNRLQPDHWLSTFASTATSSNRQKSPCREDQHSHVLLVAANDKNSSSHKIHCEQIF